MRTEYLIEKVFNPYMRGLICGEAHRLAQKLKGRRYRKAFKDLVAWGWIRISDSPENWSDKLYLRASFSEMHRYYCENVRAKGYHPRYPADDKAVQRVRRFFKKKLQKNDGESLEKRPMHNRGSKYE